MSPGPLPDDGAAGQPESPPPGVVADLFRSREKTINRFVDFLCTEGVVRGLLGPREGARIWSRHVLNCAVIAPAFGSAAEVADVGSGAGLPGMVLAIARPDLTLTLIEPLLRRTVFLHEAVERLDLSNVEVVRARAEELHGTRRFTAVTSRAVAPLDRLVGWCLPLCRPGGEMIAMKGSNVRAELPGVQKQLRRLHAGAVGIETWGDRVLDVPTTVLRIQSG